MDLEYETQAQVLEWLVEMVQEDGRLDEAALACEGLTTVPVHAEQLVADWFGTWINRYETCLRAGEVIQVIPPPSWFCAHHAGELRRLDRPSAEPDR